MNVELEENETFKGKQEGEILAQQEFSSSFNGLVSSFSYFFEKKMSSFVESFRQNCWKNFQSGAKKKFNSYQTTK